RYWALSSRQGSTGLRYRFSEVQQARLQSRLPEVLRYLANPTFEQYYWLKTEGLAARLELSLPAKRLLFKNGLAPHEWASRPPIETLRALWDSVHATNAAVRPS